MRDPDTPPTGIIRFDQFSIDLFRNDAYTVMEYLLDTYTPLTIDYSVGQEDVN